MSLYDENSMEFSVYRKVSINSPSGEGGEGEDEGWKANLLCRRFPLILLQAKAVRIFFVVYKRRGELN